MPHATACPPRPLTWHRHSLWLALLPLLWLTACAGLPSNVARPMSTAWANPEQTALGQLMAQQLSQQAKPAPPAGRNTGNRRGPPLAAAAAPPRNDSGFLLLDSAAAAFSSRLALIDAAQKTLDLQYYAIHADPTTELLFQHLRRAAARGVRIRILLDDFNSTGTHAQVLKLAFEPGIALRLFNPLPGGRGSSVLRVFGSLNDVPRIQRRMHNKIFVADNAVAITGGRNLGETYFGQGNDTNFVDLDVLAAGPIVRDLSASFDQYWNNPLAYPVQALVSKAELAALKAAGAPQADTPAAPPSPTAATPTAPRPAPFNLQQLALTRAAAVVLVDKPSKIGADVDDVEGAQETLIDGLLQLFDRAQKDLLIVSPYFVPGERTMAVFAGLRQRGVRIRVLTNSLASNDAPLAHVGYARYREALLKRGIELFEMRSEQSGSIAGLGSGGSGGSVGSRASLHTKLVVMDGRLIVVGSMNLDLRSQLQNSEVALLMRSQSLSAQATRLIETTLTNEAYRVQLVNGQLVWTAPARSGLPDSTREPDASTHLQLMLKLIGPFAPEEML